uniref:Ig-like domain-containing protein n=2 Tax=Amphimedon queenslandica TaxID=400682 RepID=A0A1X7T8K1_AMPQE
MIVQSLLMAVSCYAASFVKAPSPTTDAIINGSARIDCIITGGSWNIPNWKINDQLYDPRNNHLPLPAGASSDFSGLLIDPVTLAWNNTSFQCYMPGIISGIGYLFVYYQEVILISSSSSEHVISSSLAVSLPNESSYGSRSIPTDTEAEVSSLKDLPLRYDIFSTSADDERFVLSSSMYSMSEGSLNSEIEQTQETNGVDHVDMRFVYVVTPVLVTGTCLFIVVTLGISLRCYYIKKVKKKNTATSSNEEYAISRNEPFLSSIQRHEVHHNPAYGMVERRTGIMCINQAYGLVTGHNDESRLRHNPAYGVIRL